MKRRESSPICKGEYDEKSTRGRVLDFEDRNELDDLMRKIERKTAFRVEGHRLELVGICLQCQ